MRVQAPFISLVLSACCIKCLSRNTTYIYDTKSLHNMSVLRPIIINFIFILLFKKNLRGQQCATKFETVFIIKQARSIVFYREATRQKMEGSIRLKCVAVTVFYQYIYQNDQKSILLYNTYLVGTDHGFNIIKIIII